MYSYIEREREREREELCPTQAVSNKRRPMERPRLQAASDGTTAPQRAPTIPAQYWGSICFYYPTQCRSYIRNIFVLYFATEVIIANTADPSGNSKWGNMKDALLNVFGRHAVQTAWKKPYICRNRW